MSAPHRSEPNQSGQSGFIRQSGAKSRTSRISAGAEGTGVALALGGGFARGFAHLGILEVLEQEHIAVSAIAGTSIGGLLGAAYADGFTVRELCEIGSQVSMRDFIRFQRSAHIAPGSDRIGQFVQGWFQAGQVEELCIPTAIVTTDIDTCAPHVFTRGPLEVALRATCAFPGLFQPVAHEGRLLADGCLVAPVPTSVAARMNALCVLGVDVGSGTSGAPGSDTACSRFSQPRGRSRRKQNLAGRVPNPSLQEPSWLRYADLLLEPDVQQVHWDDFASVDQAHAAGVSAMRGALPRLRELLDLRSSLRRPEHTSGLAQSGLAL
jgi:NTE family protein